MCIQALNHNDRLDDVLKGIDPAVPHGKLFGIVLNLMPSSLSAAAKFFGALIVSALAMYGVYFLWRDVVWRAGKWRD
jgi:hypothetical protein